MAPACARANDSICLDEPTIEALKSFDRAVVPNGLAAWGNDGEAVRLRTDHLLQETDCLVLVAAGEKLLAAAAACGGGTMVKILDRLPRLTARKAVMASLASTWPDILERDWLKSQLEKLQAQQVTSTCTYLEELTVLRERLRRCSASGDAGNGADLTVRTSSRSRTWSPGRREEEQECVSRGRARSRGVPERQDSTDSVSRRNVRISEESNEDDDDDDVHDDEEDEEDEEEVSTRDTPFWPARQKRLDHNHAWDAVENLPEDMQRLFGRVISEKLRCFKDQGQAATLAELKALCNKLPSAYEEPDASKLKSALDEALRDKAKVEYQLMAQHKRLEVLDDDWQKKTKVVQQLMMEKERARIESQELLENLDFQLQQVSQEYQGVKDQIAQASRKRAKIFKRRNSVIGSGLIQDAEDVKDILENQLPQFAKALSQELQDEGIHKHISSICLRLLRHYEALQVEHRHEAKHRADGEERAEAASAQIAELQAALHAQEASICQARDAMTEKQREVEELEVRLSLDQGTLKVDSEKTVVESELYRSVALQRDILAGELQDLQTVVQSIVQERRVHQEYKSEFQEKIQRELEARDAQIEALQEEVREALTSQFHPAKVAALRAEHKFTRHEYQAALNANAILRSALDVMRQRLTDFEERRPPVVGRSQTGPLAVRSSDSQAQFVLNTCNRTVFSRLYEDAVRRIESDPAELPDPQPWFLDPEAEDDPPSSAPPRTRSMYSPRADALPTRIQSMDRRSSEPTMLAMATALREMLATNAKDLQESFEEPLFEEPLRFAPSKLKKIAAGELESGDPTMTPTGSRTLPVQRRHTVAIPSRSAPMASLEAAASLARSVARGARKASYASPEVTPMPTLQ
ncbi:unnamed protein product, partial [Polarella glacialis]